MMKFLEPFRIKMKNRSISLEYDETKLVDLINDTDLFQSIDQNELIKKNLCTDFKIYESILFHLLQNAIKFSPSFSTVSVFCQFKPIQSQEAKLHGYLVTKIIDKGPGFEADKNLKIFKTFAQVGLNQTKCETSGVGIGLSTAQALCQFLGGKL